MWMIHVNSIHNRERGRPCCHSGRLSASAPVTNRRCSCRRRSLGLPNESTRYLCDAGLINSVPACLVYGDVLCRRTAVNIGPRSPRWLATARRPARAPGFVRCPCRDVRCASVWRLTQVSRVRSPVDPAAELCCDLEVATLVAATRPRPPETDPSPSRVSVCR